MGIGAYVMRKYNEYFYWSFYWTIIEKYIKINDVCNQIRIHGLRIEEQ